MKVEELVKILREMAAINIGGGDAADPDLIAAADLLEAQAEVVAAAHRLMQREEISAWVDMRRALARLAELEKQ